MTCALHSATRTESFGTPSQALVDTATYDFDTAHCGPNRELHGSCLLSLQPPQVAPLSRSVGGQLASVDRIQEAAQHLGGLALVGFPHGHQFGWGFP